MDRVIAHDGMKGDQYGPFDDRQREYEKQRLSDKSGHKAIRRSSVPAQREASLEDEISESDEDLED